MHQYMCSKKERTNQIRVSRNYKFLTNIAQVQDEQREGELGMMDAQTPEVNAPIPSINKDENRF